MATAPSTPTRNHAAQAPTTPAHPHSPEKTLNPRCEAALPDADRLQRLEYQSLELLALRSRRQCPNLATIEAVHFLSAEKFGRFCRHCWSVYSIFLPEYDAHALNDEAEGDGQGED